MTTQELKQQIDRVLGNNIRCLLPSYWWKRLFSLTLEKVDEKLDATNIKTINGESIVGEGNLKVGVTTVGSIDELNALEASVGDIATVGEESTMLVSVGDLQQVDGPSEILEKWDSLTRIVKVEFGEPVTENGRQVIVYLNEKKPYARDTIFISSSEGGFLCAYGGVGGMREITIEEVNERLKKHDYRFFMGINVDAIDSTFKLHAYSASANAYIKGDSWDKLAKEYIVSSEEELNTMSVENGTIAKVARELKQINRANCHTVIKFSDIPANWDKFTRVDKVEHIGGNTSNSCGINLAHYDGHNYVVLRINFKGSVTYVSSVYVDSTNTNEESITKAEVDVMLKEYDFRYIGPTFTMGEPYIDSTFILYEKDISVDAYIKGETWTRLLKEGDVTGGGADITIDSELSDTSENPVQNKAVKAYIDNAITNTLNTEV